MNLHHEEHPRPEDAIARIRTEAADAVTRSQGAVDPAVPAEPCVQVFVAEDSWVACMPCCDVGGGAHMRVRMSWMGSSSSGRCAWECRVPSGVWTATAAAPGHAPLLGLAWCVTSLEQVSHTCLAM